MMLLEFEAKKILEEYRIPTERAVVVDSSSVGRLGELASHLGRPLAVKAQVRGWGRGRAGLVRRTEALEEAEVLIHEAGRSLMRSAGLWGFALYRRRFHPPEARPLRGVLRVGELEARVIHAPGHTPGSVCAAAGSLLFTGDTLFEGAVGATSFPGGSRKDLEASLAKLASLPGRLHRAAGTRRGDHPRGGEAAEPLPTPSAGQP